MKRLLLLLPALALLAACTHKEWHKAGETPQAYSLDQLNCTQMANDKAPPNHNLDVRVIGRITDPYADIHTRDDNQGARRYWFDNCMQAKGWTVTNVPN